MDFAGLKSQVLVKTVEIILIVLIALFLARLFWVIVAPLNIPVGEVTAEPQSLAASNLENVNPFAISVDESVPEEDIAAAEALQETTLDLTLYGTWIDDSGGTAFIGEADSPQARYQTGDTIANGVILEEVHKDWVVLSRGGVLEALRIKNRRAPENSGLLNKTAAAPVDEVAMLRDAIKISVNPSNAEGPQILLFPGNNPARFEAMGLVPGDVLLAIDDLEVSIATLSAPQIQERLNSSDPVRVTVERNGAPVTITVEVQPGEADGGTDDDA